MYNKMDAQEYVFKNDIVQGLEESFGNIIMEPSVKLKIKRNRRRHLIDRARLK